MCVYVCVCVCLKMTLVQAASGIRYLQYDYCHAVSPPCANVVVFLQMTYERIRCPKELTHTSQMMINTVLCIYFNGKLAKSTFQEVAIALI